MPYHVKCTRDDCRFEAHATSVEEAEQLLDNHDHILGLLGEL